MKKLSALLVAALILGLGGCGQKPPAETPSAATAVPAVSPTAEVTAKPSSTPVSTAAVPETPAAESSTPAPTATTAMPAESPKPTPVPPAPTPAPVPEPTESLCGLPLAPTPTPTPEVTPEPPPTEEPAPSPEPVPEFVSPSDEEILAAYREAADVMSWFAGYGGDLILNFEDQVTRGDVTYFRVNRSGWSTIDELRGYLKSLFSDEIVDPLLSMGCFIETENGLYALPAGRGSDVTKGGVVLSVLRTAETPALCIVQADVELLEWAQGAAEPTVAGHRTYQFPYQKVGDKWVFTQFESIF